MNESTEREGHSKIEGSIFTLLSLYILMDQQFTALYRYRKLLESEYDYNLNDKGIYFDTIREALIYQLLLKACAFIDEWDQYLGLKTEEEYALAVHRIKRVVKPARKIINRWKGLRQYRNQVIAHNHRDEKGNNIYLKRRFYHTPETIGDFGLMMYALEKIVRVLTEAFPLEFKNAFSRPGTGSFYPDRHPDENFFKDELIKLVDETEVEIRTNLTKAGFPFVNVTSEYEQLLKAHSR